MINQDFYNNWDNDFYNHNDVITITSNNLKYYFSISFTFYFQKIMSWRMVDDFYDTIIYSLFHLC